MRRSGERMRATDPLLREPEMVRSSSGRAERRPPIFEAETEQCSHCHSEHNPLTHYVIVRDDLPRGVLAAQIVHAAGESSPGGLPEGTYAVVLAVKDEHALEREAKRLRTRGVELTEIRETDAPFSGALMALGLAPRERDVLRRHVSSLPLLR